MVRGQPRRSGAVAVPRPPGESIAACYFDGTSTNKAHPPEGAAPPVFQRMLFLLDGQGLALEWHGGSKTQLPLARPG
jgi:hypothetical protein